MTRVLFGNWLKEFDDDVVAKKRNIPLILYNCSAHRLYAELKALKILFLPPNVTAKLQPLDMGIIQNFKAIIIVATMQNCFRKAGFVCSLTSAASVEHVVFDVVEDALQEWRETIETQLVSDADDLDDFAAADDALWMTEELDDSTIVREVQASRGAILG
ncbi:hypothetical protein HPB51_001596 [Rhipicephalus microplus]|uniref:DDE-1 domain-containing protein n=1 Tax=Rhipicephalus microplus TaxID=6941 RepID=A0A9J6EQ72_RHIMP|nr:hypothetical protein HPB51_001596 [Rhipicephalus microplus]